MDITQSSNRIINSFPPLNNITPFTRVDGWSFLEVLEGLRHYVVEVLVKEIDDKNEQIIKNLNAFYDQYINDFQNVKDGWQELFDQFMLDVVAQLEGLNDQAMANLVKNHSSVFYQALLESYTYGARVDDYGIIGAVDKAHTDKSVVYISGDNTVTENIPNLWNVDFAGSGSIIRDGYTFIPNPKPNPLIHENKIFVHAQNGNDSNDGLTPNLPIKSLAKLQNILRGLTAAQAAGARWFVQLGGVFPEGQRFYNLPDFPLTLKIVGESPVAGKPVTRVNNGSDSSPIGFWMEKCPSTVEIEDIHFDGFNSYTGYGILGKGSGDLRIRRCRFSNCSYGTAAIKNMDYSFSDNYYEATCDTGSMAQYNSSGTWNREIIDGCTNGITVTRGTVCHIDYCTIQGTDRGVLVDMSSRANALRTHFKRNGVGVRTSGAGEWVNTECLFYVGTVDGNETDFENRGVGRESRLYSTGRNEWLIGDAWTAQASYQEPKLISGTGNQVVYLGSGLGVLPENFFTDRTKKLRVVVYGYTTSPLAFSANISLFVTNRDGTGIESLCTGTVRGGTNGNFRMEMEVWAMDDTRQKYLVVNQAHTVEPSIYRGDKTVTFQTERLFRLYCEPMAAGDGVYFTNMETWLQG